MPDNAFAAKFLRNGIAMLAASLVVAAAGPAVAETFTIIDGPNADWTEVTAINAGGSVTGNYNDSAIHGFLRTPDGTFTSFDAPHGRELFPDGINRKGEITGSYGPGFLRRPGGKILHFRAGGGTAPAAINDNGVIAGNYYGSTDGHSHGFLRGGDGTITSFDPTGSVATTPKGIDAQGDITGYYLASNYQNDHGFVRTADGTITSFDVEGAAYTNAYGINRKGAIVGYAEFETGPRKFLGFERFPDGRIKTFDVQKSQYNIAYAISGHGMIAGSWSEYLGRRLQLHGFVGSPKSGFTSFDPPNSTNTYPVSINDSGVVAGYFTGTDGITHGFIRTP